jgi:small subunit ribosomal protein S14
MAKKSAVERNLKRQRLAAKYAAKRAALKEIARDTEKPVEERFAAQLKLADLPRNSAPTRVRNRCQVSGRPRGYYRKLKDVAHRAASAGEPRVDPGHGQVELVGRSQDECE